MRRSPAPTAGIMTLPLGGVDAAAQGARDRHDGLCGAVDAGLRRRVVQLGGLQSLPEKVGGAATAMHARAMNLRRRVAQLRGSPPSA